MEPKLKDILTEIQKLNRRMDKIEKMLESISKAVPPQDIWQSKIVPPLDVSDLQMETLCKIARAHELEDHYCPVTLDHKHILPLAWAGVGPIPCQLCGKNTGGVIK